MDPSRKREDYMTGKQPRSSATPALPEVNRPRVIVGHSAAMQRIEHEIEAAAASDVIVLIAGESGAGRRLIARTIHGRSVRHGGPYVSVNCACLPDARLESELFGHVHDADDGSEPYSVRGRLESADGGTIVLQDVGYLSWRMQGRLLRYIETKEVLRVGSDEVRSADVRIMAVTHRRLVHAVTTHVFREDLFYRMNVIHIEVPPLRERCEDIPALLRYFLYTHGARQGRAMIEFTSDALACLTDYDWPGNVRELKEVTERLALTHTSERVGVDALPDTIVRRAMSRTVSRWRSPKTARGRFTTQPGAVKV
jgi:DNA-binding NtrC family response regulator